MKSLVVYYTRTGNTKFVAETIAAELGSDIEEVIDLKKRGGTLGYMAAGRDATGEKLTEIAPTKQVPKDYDLIIVGTPVWAWRPSAAIRTYLSKNDLSGKKVALFFTMDGKLREAIEKTKSLIPNAVFIGELALAKPTSDKDATAKKIVDWCGTIKKQFS
jgi:flavodoxin